MRARWLPFWTYCCLTSCMYHSVFWGLGVTQLLREAAGECRELCSCQRAKQQAHPSRHERACTISGLPDMERCARSSWQSAPQEMPTLSQLLEKGFVLFKGSARLSVHVLLLHEVFCTVRIIFLFPSSGHSQQHRELECGSTGIGKNGNFQISSLHVSSRTHGQKGMPSISVMRNDVAVLGTAGLAHMKTAFLELPLLKFKLRQKIMAFYKIVHVFIDIVIFCLLNRSGIHYYGQNHSAPHSAKP